MRAGLIGTLIWMVISGPAWSAPCGGEFDDFLAQMTAEAVASGVPEPAAAAYIGTARQDARVLKADRSQTVFRKTFVDFARALISKDRLTRGRQLRDSHAALFARAEAEFGVPPGILLAFWAFETDYGAVQGDFNTRDALLTLAHDCRRPDLFQPQVLAAARLHAEGRFDTDLTGAWAGEIGMVQMLPADIAARGVDGDGDGLVALKSSVPDAILSAARLLQHHGWRKGEPWLQEIVVPGDLDWSLTGLDTVLPVADWQTRGVTARDGGLASGLSGSVLLPQGRGGPAFLAYPNYAVLFDWNQSFVYVTTAAYFATRLGGASAFDAGSPEPGLDGEAMMDLQTRLAALGHDVGKIDGVLGAATRRAVQAEQVRLGLPADAWPTVALLRALKAAP